MSTLYNLDALILESQVVVSDTTNSSITSGALTVEGGLSTKDTHVTGHVAINNVKITPNLNDIIFELQATLNPDTMAMTNITDFYFDSSIARTFKAMINVFVSGAESKYALWELNGVYKPTGWIMHTNFTGDITGVNFGVSTNESGIGQIQYTNPNTTGSTTTIRYRAHTTAPVGSSPLVSTGIINNTSGPFIVNGLVFSNSVNTLSNADANFTNNVFSIGDSSRLVTKNLSTFQSFSNGGSFSVYGGASVAKNLIIGDKIGIANTNPSYPLDIVGDINFTGDLYQNGNLFGGGGGGVDSNWLSGTGGNLSYTKGNVGIGTTAPTFKLDINGNLRVTTGITTGNIYASGTSTLTNISSSNQTTAILNASIGITTASIYANNGTFGAIITTSGNVGIGTSSPSQVLDILTNSNEELGMGLSNSNTGGNSRINFNMYVGHNTSGNAGQIYASTSDPTFTIRTYSANTSGISLLTGGAAPIKFNIQNTERMRINTSGNVGIGTTSPSYTLDINPSNVYSAMRVNGGSILSNTNGTVINMSPNEGAFGAIEAFTSGNFNVKIPLCLNPWGGNVGIGMTSPSLSYKLDVNGSLHVNGIYSNFSNSTTGYLQIARGWESNSGFIEFLQANGTRKGYIGYGGDTVAFQFIGEGSRNIELATNSVTQMTVTSSGNIGMGTGTPSVRLQVMNNGGGQSTTRIYASGNSIQTDWPVGWGGGLNTFDISCAGIYYNTLSQRSDIRKKDNITTYSRGLDEIIQLRPVSFNWKDYNSTEVQYGFIAQEVEEVIPELVNEDSNGYKNIKNAYIPILVNAIKELNNKVNELKQELDILKNI
jgi:hypothetical protein